jgi:hypothetical protein
MSLCDGPCRGLCQKMNWLHACSLMSRRSPSIKTYWECRFLCPNIWTFSRCPREAWSVPRRCTTSKTVSGNKVIIWLSFGSRIGMPRLACQRSRWMNPNIGPSHTCPSVRCKLFENSVCPFSNCVVRHKVPRLAKPRVIVRVSDRILEAPKTIGFLSSIGRI